MAYRIEFRPAARRDIRRIPMPFQARVLREIMLLADQPRPAGCVRLQGPEGFLRIRIGDYRVIYQVGDRVLLVCVIRIGHRKDIYRSL